MATQNPKKRNKIINNSYKSGDNLRGDDYHFDKVMSVEAGYATTYLGSIYDVENNMVYRKVQEEVMRFIEECEELKGMFGEVHEDGEEDKPAKFNRERINRIFKLIYEHFVCDAELRQFSNTVYIFDNVSNLTGLKYNNLFDMLDSSYKEKLLIELDKQFDILRTGGKSSKLF